MEKLQKEVGRLEGKLGNEKFVASAPEEVVAKEREKLTSAQESQAKLQEQYKKIEAL